MFALLAYPALAALPPEVLFDHWYLRESFRGAETLPRLVPEMEAAPDDGAAVARWVEAQAQVVPRRAAVVREQVEAWAAGRPDRPDVRLAQIAAVVLAALPDSMVTTRLVPEEGGTWCDADGKMDVAVGSAGGNQIFAYFGTGTGSFTRVLLPIVSAGGGVSIGEVTGDGALDLVSVSFDNQILLFEGNGASRTFEEPRQIGVVGAFANALETADLDGDGIEDVVTVDNEGTVVVLLADGAGGFVPATALETSPATGAFVVADLDFDRHADIRLRMYEPSARHGLHG